MRSLGEVGEVRRGDDHGPFVEDDVDDEQLPVGGIAPKLAEGERPHVDDREPGDDGDAPVTWFRLVVARWLGG